MNEKMNEALEQLEDSDFTNLDLYFQLVDGLKSIRFLASDVSCYASLKKEERDKLECVSSLSKMLENRLKMNEFSNLVDLLSAKRKMNPAEV